jgi:hypothetical protein
MADVAGRPIDRRAFLVVATGLALGMLRPARSQAAGKPYRIGFLGNSTAALEANLVGPFRDGLREEATSRGATSSSTSAGPRASTSDSRRWSPS